MDQPDHFSFSRSLTFLVLGVLLLAGCEDPSSRLENVLKLSGTRVRGRLYGLAGTTFGRSSESRGSRHPRRDTSALLEASYLIERAALNDPGWRELSDLGVLRMAAGENEQAIATLRAAARRGRHARPWNDLAVVYLSRFDADGRPMDLLLAAAASEEALRLEPECSEALFNRAIALSLLGLRHVPIAMWNEYLRVERDPVWSREAAAIRTAIDRPTLDESWNGRRRELERDLAAGRAPEMAEAVAAFPFRTRVWAESSLLPGWAAGVRSGAAELAAARLAAAERIGEELARQRSEGLLYDAVKDLRRTWESGDEADRARLLDALESFGDGVAAYESQDTAAASNLLERAAEELGSNPLASWARFYAAVCLSYDDNAAAHAALEKLLAELPDNRYRALAGRIQWILGTIEKVRGEVQSSVRRSQRALELLDESSGVGASAFVHVLLAESYSMLGEHEKGWYHRYRAMQDVPYVDGRRRNIAMWTEAGQALRRQEALHLARPLLDEGVAVAQEWGHPIGLATAYLSRAAQRADTTDEPGAFEDLDEALEAVDHMQPGGLRNQMHYLALLSEGLLYREIRPERTAALLSEAFELQESTGYKLSVINHLTVRASSYLRLGDHAAAEADFARAVDVFEKIRSTVEDPFSRMQAFRQAQPAFEHLAMLALDRGAAQPESLFELAERARARLLLDLVAEGRPHSTFATLERLEEELPLGTVVAEFMVLPDRLLAWVVEPGASRRVELDVSAEDLRQLLDGLRTELERRASEENVRVRGAELYDRLIRPLALPSGNGNTLVIVPDRFLSRLPWLALFDRQSERYLIEERPVSMAPSATLLLGALEEERRRRTSEDLSLLAVGVSESVAYAGRSFPRLRQAEAEVSRVASSYLRDRVLVLEAGAATQKRFVEKAPGFEVVHFAGHAVADPEVITRSVLLFHPADPSDTGALPLSWILELQLDRALLVVLSACQTLETLSDDREGFLGLGGAFLASGVPAVLASQWDVDDEYAARLMPLFHQKFAAGLPASIALREAVLHLMSTETINQPSPADWANFVVLGGIGH